MDTQGELVLEERGGHLIGCIIPTNDPQAWYFEPFPSREVAEDYARKFNLAVRDKETE